MKKGEVIENLEIVDISSDGRGIGKSDGQAIFVKKTVPGDMLDVKVLGKRKKVLQGGIVNLRKPSSFRQDPFCSHFDLCGGCKWQNMTYEAQLKFKQEQVEQNLKKISGITLPKIESIVRSPKSTFYRNKLEYTFSNNRWLTNDEINSGAECSRNGVGFHIPGRYDKILNIEKCYLQEEVSNKIRNGFREFAEDQRLSFFDLKTQSGFLRNLIVRTTTTGDLMVILQVAEADEDKIELCMEFLKDTYPEITSLMYVVNEKGNDTFQDLEVHCYDGNDYIMEKMDDLQFRIGPKSFYQTNSIQAHALYKIVRNYAGLTGKERVYDLYTGTGTIANFLADQAAEVIGLEYVESAIEDARKNSKLNGISNTKFFAGDMKDLLKQEFITEHGKPDVVITDPPRAGMHQRVTELLAELKADRIVYVSCNPATQARDLQTLGKSYEVIKIQPVDMFPHTQHVESVVLLELRK